jgi:hypothetical protein
LYFGTLYFGTGTINRGVYASILATRVTGNMILMFKFWQQIYSMLSGDFIRGCACATEIQPHTPPNSALPHYLNRNEVTMGNRLEFMALGDGTMTNASFRIENPNGH